MHLVVINLFSPRGPTLLYILSQYIRDSVYVMWQMHTLPVLQCPKSSLTPNQVPHPIPLNATRLKMSSLTPTKCHTPFFSMQHVWRWAASLYAKCHIAYQHLWRPILHTGKCGWDWRGRGYSPSGTSTVQFMWQPLTDIVYPKIMLLASFEVRLSLHQKML